MSGIIDHAMLNQLAMAGAVDSVQVSGQPGGWTLLVRCGHDERHLAAQRSRQVRLFKRLETLIIYLKNMGIERFDVDTTGFAIHSEARVSRPDRSQALKRAHDAAAWEQWFHEQVEISQNDARPAIGNQQVREIFAARKRALLKE